MFRCTEFLYSGTENCEFSTPRTRFSQIPPQGPPPGHHALRQTTAPGKKPDGVATGADSKKPQHCEVPVATEHSFPGKLPDLRRLALVPEALPDEAAQLEEKRGRDNYPVRVARDSRRASARAVAGPGTQPQPGARCAASTRWNTGTSRGLTTTVSRTSPEPRRRGAATSPGSCEAFLRVGSLTAWSGSCGSKAELPDFGERPGCDGKAVDSHGPDQSQDRQDPRRRPGKARDDRRRREDRQR